MSLEPVPVRPSAITSLVIGVLVALGALALTVLAFVIRPDGRPWHYWIAPVMVLQVVLFLFAIAAGYYWRAIRPEVKGRPRGE